MHRNKLLWKNNSQQYGLLGKSLHWFSALAVFALFVSGYWMVELDYSNSWYQTAPHWHESVGILLIAVTLFRLLWRGIGGLPDVISSHSAIEQKASAGMVMLLYMTLFSVLISGFLISSADEQAIAVFDWFKVSPIVLAIKNQEDTAGVVHYYLAYSIIIFALLHAVAALKHHFIDKDNTLKRMTKL